MTTFVCTQCNYRFDSNSEKIPKKCPYCSKPGVRREKSAEELVKEVSNMLGE